KPSTEYCMPGQGPGVAGGPKARTHGDIGAILDNRSQENRQLRGSVAIVSVEENDHIRILRIRKPCQASAPVASARLLDDLCSHLSGEIGRSVSRIAVDHDDFRDEIGRQIGKHTANGLRFVIGWNDHRYSHADLITTTETRGASGPATRRRPSLDLRVLPPVRALRAPEPVVPKSTTCPIPRPTGSRGTGTRPRRPDASA